MDAAQLIRRAGLRVTDSRRAVVVALADHPHASADELFQQVSEDVPQTSLQSVYNALGDFVEVGLVRRIEPAGHPRLYELRARDNHHHLVCSKCGVVKDVDCAVGAAPCLEPSDARGFAIETAEVTFWGVCPTCVAAPIPAREEGKT
ncbi:Fur family transcriptional regulator (plasmid) [Coraliomargarita sp. W4R53]